MTTLVEELLLLAFDDTTGRDRSGGHLELGLAGAIVLELTMAGRLDVADKKVRVIDTSPVGDPVLDGRLAAIAADKPRAPKSVVERTAKGLKQAVLAALVADGVLRHRRDTALGIFPVHRYLPNDPAAEADARARLGAAVDAGEAADARTAALAVLVYALRLERVAFPGRKAGPTRKALKAVAEGSWAGEATRQAVDAAQAAVMAAVIAATAAATAAGGS
ncbi:GPP34 family phosphoprotein [Glycomyces sp. TRM65418]|uniref:GOLPH3/VPS74 family protein n=1 Tax=Glycomyces sp. TRM65418 TaxID=2867006 RepID=UPI001CE567F5|nr:GPP34 family phosphoprotein [Glycomyces sp. TRM65418]MCC3764025.1 GPP34 family phosphoprotein [Glycomyces sp. TRM65418]QZD53716.1 GPP34 family phosphoprotein [Glycomyces sp. TRM65418]